MKKTTKKKVAPDKNFYFDDKRYKLVVYPGDGFALWDMKTGTWVLDASNMKNDKTVRLNCGELEKWPKGFTLNLNNRG